MKRSKKIVLTAILLALLVVLSRFLSIKTPITKISFAFLPTMLCATWLGWKWTVLLNVLGDLIGATLFPSGPYFVGYTISTAIAGFIYGFLLYQGNHLVKKSTKKAKAVAARSDSDAEKSKSVEAGQDVETASHQTAGLTQKQLIWRAIIATTLVAVIVNMGLNTLWTSITAGKAFWPLLGTRVVKQLIMIPIHVVVFLLVEKATHVAYLKYIKVADD